MAARHHFNQNILFLVRGKIIRFVPISNQTNKKRKERSEKKQCSVADRTMITPIIFIIPSEREKKLYSI